VLSKDLQRVALSEGDYQRWQQEFLADSSEFETGPR
jgi:hypothetical protein